jgi:uncharacterized protein Yka (UPF0111/DUF47 family)
MKVAFNGDDGQEVQYDLAVKEYEARIWNVLARLRVQTSKARRLISEQGYRKLVNLYDQIGEYDSRLDQIVRRKLTGKQLSTALAPLHRELRVDMTKKLDEALDLLAREVELKAPGSPSKHDPETAP